MPGPYPDRFTESGREFDIIETTRGHMGVNLFSSGSASIDADWRRHATPYEDSSFSGEHPYE